jgi:hypothetical protein
MLPSYKSDKPGTAPDCGMLLEPVYADDAAAGNAVPIPGALRVSDDKRQLIGVRVARVDAQPVQRLIRTVGRVAVDDLRLRDHRLRDHRDLLAVLHGVPGAREDLHEEPVDRRHDVLRDAQEIHDGDPVALADPAADGRDGTERADGRRGGGGAVGVARRRGSRGLRR